MNFIQKILFGSPGVGKSYKIGEIARYELGINDNTHIVNTVFHPEYKYSDFMGKLLPLSSGQSIVYKYYNGHFLQALGKAYRGIVNNNEENYLLVIDELNRGNAVAIFGTVFQLLDRDGDGWSNYKVDISDMEMLGLIDAMGYKASIHNDVIMVGNSSLDRFIEELDQVKSHNVDILQDCLKNKKISIPPNLSIIGTINTSDESIYYLDTAFKRRWEWEYIDAPSEINITSYPENKNSIPEKILNVSVIKNEYSDFPELKLYRIIVGINEFIKSCHQSVRRIEDKQIGWWFINTSNSKLDINQVKNKLMFYLWDSVFARDKRPLIKLIEDKLNKNNIKLVTYADFLGYSEDLLRYWHGSVPEVEQE